jgi:AraC-like DNA-binding protein
MTPEQSRDVTPEESSGLLGLNPTPPPPPHTWVKSDHLARAHQAWTARVAGATWQQVAELTGYSSPENAMRAVRTVYGQVPRIDRDDLRHLWRDRLEALWRQVLRDLSEQRPGAVTAAVRVMQAAAALDGLNEAVKVDLGVSETFQKITEELISNGL